MPVTIKITGIIKDVFPVETYGNFTKRVIWVEEIEQNYNSTFQVEFNQNKIQELKGIKSGDVVEIDADLTGRYVAKNGKEYVFNSVNGWRIKKI
ncbi:DUF3127 domain-containing protein [Albibacterium profundi]|uniref:DUF3127 domain-containing protein n=1 Tax=Albibacterium profundi TaxID=3134906 RepID=A0ABV5CEX3_9SPHI